MTYAVTDSSGNPAVAQRKIPLRDMILPEIQLEGGEDYVITLGTRYEEPGFTATSRCRARPRSRSVPSWCGGSMGAR